MSHKRTRNRPQDFTLDRQHSLARGLVFAGLGRVRGSTHYRDSSPYGNHGVLTNMEPAKDWVFDLQLGRWVNQFNGTTQYILLPLNILSGATSWTVCGWANPSLLADDRSPFLGSVGTDTYPCIRQNLTTGNWDIYAGVGRWCDVLNKTPAFVVGAWKHVALCYDGVAVSVWCDGVGQVVKSYASGLLPNTDVARIGGGQSGSSEPWAGYIGDVLIYKNRALGSSEIQQLADPSNVMLSGLILPPRRRLWAVAAAPPATNRRRRLLIAGVPR